MKRTSTAVAILLVVLLPAAARGQYVAISGGGVFSQDFQGEGQGGIAGPMTADFSHAGILAVDGGIGVLPFIGVGLHYSYAQPDFLFRRGDAFGSSASGDLGSHTLTFDGRLQTPSVAGFRLYGLLGVGFSRFDVNVEQQVERPFPGGVPDSVLTPVFTYGGGIERGLLPFVRLKLELRDYVTGLPEEFFEPGGTWHRVPVVVGVVIGR